MGSIKHAKTSPVPNPLGDTRRVGGGDWNSEHIIDLDVSDIDGLEARLIPVDQVEQFRDDALQFRNEAAGSASDAADSAAEAAATLAGAAKTVDLADTTDAAKGAGRIGFNAALAYAANSVGGFLVQLGTSAGASLVSFAQAAVGAVSRTLFDRNSDSVHCKDFGVNGVVGVDYTVQMIRAWIYCKSKNKILELEGSIRFVEASVPVEFRSAGFGGDYVAISSMVGRNDAELIVEGNIGFLTAGLNRTIVENFKITTIGREISESQAESSKTHLFASTSGAKQLCSYRNLKIEHGVTDLTGAYRAGRTIVEYGCEQCVVRDIEFDNSHMPVLLSNCSDIDIANLTAKNVQTLIYLIAPIRFMVHDIQLLNTKQQSNTWVARLFVPPRGTNGMNALLVENGSDGIVYAINTTWAIERATYIQSRDLILVNCRARNSEGFKSVGSSRNALANNVFMSNLHMILDEDYEIGVGRANPHVAVTYWSNNVTMQNCTGRSLVGASVFRALLVIGPLPTTIKRVVVKGCSAFNANTLIYTELMHETAAELAAIDPTQTFIVVDDLVVENCYLKKGAIRFNGSLLTTRDSDSSADAKATYGVKNVRLSNNAVDNSVAGSADDWLFDPRYIDGLVSENNTVSNGFFAGFLPVAITAPYQNILMKEPFLKSNFAPGTVLGQLGNLTVLAGSKLAFSGIPSSTTVFTTIDISTTVGGLLSAGTKQITARGKGYWHVGAALDCGIQLTAAGNFYVGKAIGGVKTDQVSTPPIVVNVSAGNVEIRGDQAPNTNVNYSAILIAN